MSPQLMFLQAKIHSNYKGKNKGKSVVLDTKYIVYNEIKGKRLIDLHTQEIDYKFFIAFMLLTKRNHHSLKNWQP